MIPRPAAVLVLVAASLLPLSVHAADKNGDKKKDFFAVEVKAKGVVYPYNHKSLQSMATQDVPSLRGTKQRKSIPLSIVVTRDTGVSLDEIEQILLVGAERTLLLEAENLEYLDRLFLKVGTLRPSIYPDADETWRAMQPEFGAPRFKNLEKIFVFRTGELK